MEQENLWKMNKSDPHEFAVLVEMLHYLLWNLVFWISSNFFGIHRSLEFLEWLAHVLGRKASLEDLVGGKALVWLSSCGCWTSIIRPSFSITLR